MAKAREQLARTNLLDFVTYVSPGYLAEQFHVSLAGALEDVVAGRESRLIILAPPQHGKSHLASVHLPAYWLGRRPDDPVILSSYAASLAESKSRQAREIVESATYRDLFPGIGLRKDSRAVANWTLGSGRNGGMLAVGVGGAVTGHGGRLGIIDDPVENWEQAQSQTVRDATWEWYRTTFRPRIWQGGAILIIMTRWHEDDLVGRLLSEHTDTWRVLRYPALAEGQSERDENNKRLGLPVGEPDILGRDPGLALAPQRFASATLLEIRRDVGALAWNAEYMGSPTGPEGTMFKRSWFDVVDSAPAAPMRIVRYWDKAGSEGRGDYTVGVRMSVDRDGVYYVEDVQRGRLSSLQRNELIRQTALRDGYGVHIHFEQEPGSGGKESAEITVRQLAGFVVRPDRVTGGREARGRGFAAQCEARNVKLVRGRWVPAYLDEMGAVPFGVHDDQFTASVGAFNKLVGRLGGVGRIF